MFNDAEGRKRRTHTQKVCVAGACARGRGDPFRGTGNGFLRVTFYRFDSINTVVGPRRAVVDKKGPEKDGGQ